MILGLDISTSCTGWCILDNGKLKAMDAIDLSKKKSIYAKASAVQTAISNLNIQYDIDSVFIEENLQAFRPGLSSAKTLLTLARFNGVVSYLCHQEFFYEPVYINVNSARKSLDIKLVRGKKAQKSTKEQVLEWVSDQLSDTNHQWPIKILKSGPRKGQSVLTAGCYDMADAYVIARSGYEQLKKYE